MPESVVIDCLPSSAARYVSDHTIVAVDVIRATTMAMTAVAGNRRCVVAANLDDAFALRDKIEGALLAGELEGDVPEGFDMNNSPARLAERGDARPLVMLSSSGTQLMLEASKSAQGALIASFRNFTATARHLIGRSSPVAIIGAGSRGEFREEDQMGCAWVAGLLVSAGFRPENAQTAEIIERWLGLPASACGTGNSVDYLRRSGQLDDYDFVITHVDDLDIACSIEGNEIRVAATAATDARGRGLAR
ncbi:MAG: 2-phosphosulfolactate phosphatase [Candidatus Limnocylindrales bacterium]